MASPNSMMFHVFRVGARQRIACCRVHLSSIRCSSAWFTRLFPHTPSQNNRLRRLQSFDFPSELCSHSRSLYISSHHLSSQANIETEATNAKAGEDGKKEKKKMTKVQKMAYAIFSVTFGLWALVLVILWGAPPKDEEGNEIKDEFSDYPLYKLPLAYTQRAMREFEFFNKKIQEPSYEKLLPDPLPAPYMQPKYTIVLEMTEVLVHPEHTMSSGWRFKKRPGLEYLLEAIKPPLFEIVIFTKETGTIGFHVIDKLDPNGYIMYRLFRDATRYKGSWFEGYHIKDLSCLNRDLSKVIMVDCDKRAFELHPANGIAIKKFCGQEDDRELFDLAAFLSTIASSGVDDVRSVLENFGKEDDPMDAFRKNQMKFMAYKEEQQKMAKEREKQRQRNPLGSGGLGGFGWK